MLKKYVKMRNELYSILNNQTDFLNDYFVKKGTKIGFERYGDNKKGPGLTSTCFCINSIVKLPKTLEKFQQKKFFDLDQISKFILNEKWDSGNLDTYNIYTTPIVLRVLKQLGVKSNKKKIKKGLTSIIENFKKDEVIRFSKTDIKSAFLTYWALSVLGEYRNDIDFIKKKERKIIDDIIKKAYDWAEKELFEQVAFYAASDYDNYDPIRCSYALAIYDKFAKSLKKKTIQKIIQTAIKSVFHVQQDTGLWNKYKPILHIGEHGGDVYPFSIGMFQIIISIMNNYPKLFNENFGKIQKVIEWIQRNQNEIQVNQHKKTIRGWRSNHASDPNGPPETWSTALVFDAILNLERLLTRDLNFAILEKYGGKKINRKNDSLFSGLLDSHLLLNGSHHSVKKIIKRCFIDRRNQLQKMEDCKQSVLPQLYSSIFYGPPGNMKTTLAEAIAESIGWNFLRIQTSDFLSDGLENASNRMKEVFDDLMQLENTVVLFDEIDDFIKSRETIIDSKSKKRLKSDDSKSQISTDQTVKEKPTLESRMLTNSMLTLINDLRKKEKIIFIVATNNIDRLDRAIVRTGRFDSILSIGPPSKQSMKFIGNKILSKHTLPKYLDQKIIDEFIENYYDNDDLKLFNYSEWSNCVEEICSLTLNGELQNKTQIKEKMNELWDNWKSSIVLSDSEILSKYVRYKNESSIPSIMLTELKTKKIKKKLVKIKHTSTKNK